MSWPWKVANCAAIVSPLSTVVNSGFRDVEQSVVRNVRDRNLDGVFCGHIHAAAIREVDGVTHINCGDWVDSCTGIVEHGDGRMELVHWG